MRERGGTSSGWRCDANTQVCGEPPRCCFLGPCWPNCAADIEISTPLAGAGKLLKTLIIGLMVQKLIMEGITAAKITVICFPFWVIIQEKNLAKGW